MTITECAQRPWNHGQIIGPKPPLKPKHIWAILTRLQHECDPAPNTQPRLFSM